MLHGLSFSFLMSFLAFWLKLFTFSDYTKNFAVSKLSSCIFVTGLHFAFKEIVGQDLRVLNYIARMVT